MLFVLFCIVLSTISSVAGNLYLETLIDAKTFKPSSMFSLSVLNTKFIIWFNVSKFKSGAQLSHNAFVSPLYSYEYCSQ